MHLSPLQPSGGRNMDKDAVHVERMIGTTGSLGHGVAWICGYSSLHILIHPHK